MGILILIKKISSLNRKPRFHRKTCKKIRAFTLIEVLLALAIIAIGMGALLTNMSINIKQNNQLKDKIVAHWVATQAIHMIQLNLLNIQPHQTVTEITRMMGKNWYWRAVLLPTPIPAMQEIQITVSNQASGPFKNLLIGYRVQNS